MRHGCTPSDSLGKARHNLCPIPLLYPPQSTDFNQLSIRPSATCARCKHTPTAPGVQWLMCIGEESWGERGWCTMHPSTNFSSLCRLHDKRLLAFICTVWVLVDCVCKCSHTQNGRTGGKIPITLWLFTVRPWSRDVSWSMSQRREWHPWPWRSLSNVLISWRSRHPLEHVKRTVNTDSSVAATREVSPRNRARRLGRWEWGRVGWRGGWL